MSVENIRDYGAEPNSDDPDLTSAKRNLDAIRAAADAAGDYGEIYVPEGTYYWGGEDRARLLVFGGGPHEPTGISVSGDGPTKSHLIASEHMDPSQNHNFLLFESGYSHGDVTIRDIHLDGNYKKVGDLRANNTGAWGLLCKGAADSDSWTLENVHHEGWYTGGIRINTAPINAYGCTFEQNGIGNAVSSESTASGHHVVTQPSDGNQSVFDHCEFLNASGQCINVDYGEGNVRSTYCWAKGCGVAYHKISAGDRIEVHNTYIQPWSQWLEDNLKEETQDLVFPLVGRRFIHRRSDNATPTPTVDLNNVVCTKTIRDGFRTANHPLDLRGDVIAVSDIGMPGNSDYSATHAFEEGNDGLFRSVDLGRISVHEVDDAPVFGVPNAEGSVESIRRDNTEGMGDEGGIAIGADDAGGNPYEPDVPAQSEVGISGGSLAVTTRDASDVDTTSATINATLDDLGRAENVDVYFQWHETGVTAWNSTARQTLTSTGSIESDVSGLGNSTEYEFRAVAESEDGKTSRGSKETFVTDDPVFEDFTPKRASSQSDWRVSDVGDNSMGNGTLELAAGTGDSHALSVDDVGESTDVEIIALCRVPADDDKLYSYARLYLRGDDAEGRWVWSSLTETDGTHVFRIRANQVGSLSDLGEIPVAETAVSSAIDNWFYRRLAVSGDTWRLRAWDYGDSEPDSWDIEITDGTISSSGYVGLGGYSTDVQQFDYISIGTGGESAQLPTPDKSPALAWQNPVDGAIVGDTVTIQIEASDTEDAVDSLTVDYRVDGDSWQSASYNADSGYYEDSWDTTASADGSHTLEARVTDTAGNTAKGSVSVTVDNAEETTTTGSAPVINRFSVSEAQRPDPHAEITAVWDVSDSDGDLDLVEIEVSDSSGTVQGVSWTVSGTTASDTDTFRVQDGDGATFDVTITVTDAAGQSTSVTKSVTA